jgi:hypothetical protein
LTGILDEKINGHGNPSKDCYMGDYGKLRFCLLFLVLSTTVFAFNQPMELKGIKTVNVVVANLSNDLVKDGIDRETLSTTLKLALQKAGLTVLTRDQYDGTVPTIQTRINKRTLST